MTSKRSSLLRRVLPRRMRAATSDDTNVTQSHNFETCGGVYQDAKMLCHSNKKQVMMIIHEEDELHQECFAKKLQSLDDSHNNSVTTGLTCQETISASSSFDDSDSSSTSSIPNPMNLQWRRQASQRNLFANMDCHSLDDDDDDDHEEGEEARDDQEGDTSAEWKSSGDAHHHDGAPPITLRSESQRLIDPARPELQLGDDEVLFKVLTRAARLLPRHSGNYASLHVMINNERLRQQVAPLQRLPTLDELARQHAKDMACNQSLEHADLDQLRKNNAVLSHGRIGSNVAACQDGNLRRLFKTMMKESVADRNNILDRRYAHMGVGTYKSRGNGKLYVCQVFA